MKFFCSIFLLSLTLFSRAEQSPGIQLLFLKNHLSAGVDFPVLFVKHQQHTGAGKLQVKHLPGFSFSFDYAVHFNPNLSFVTGARAGVKMFGYEAEAESKNFNIPENLFRNYRQMISSLTIPLIVQPRIFIGTKSMLEANLGAKVNFFIPAGNINSWTYREGGDLKPLFDMHIRYSGLPQVLLHGALTYGHVLKNQNILKWSLAYDFGFNQTLTGTYAFHNDDITIGNGRITSSMNSILLSVAYVFTRAGSLQITP